MESEAAGSDARDHADGYALIVDDDDELRATLADLLERQGIRVVAVAGGAQALAALSPDLRKPCVVLLDWMMPDIGGHEVIQWIADNAHLAGLPVYVVTGSPRLVTDVIPVIEKDDLDAVLEAVGRHCHPAIAV